MSRPRKQAPATQPAVRCAIYTRKSSEEGLQQEFNSLDAQREAGEAYVASQRAEGWTCLPDRYDDGGFTGGNMERPGLRRLMADIDAGKIDCVVVYKVDRLSRSLLDFARIMETFDRHHVSFVSVTQHFNTTHSMGRLTLNILLSFAQFEREIIGEHIRDKIAAQRRRGKWAGGIPILGYDVDRTGPSPRLIVNHGEAARVRAIFDLYEEKGSLLPAVRELEYRGWQTKRWHTKGGTERGGRVFDRGSLYALLTNPLYIGRIKHKTETYQGEHEAIVDPAVFASIQATLHRNGRNGGAHTRNKHGSLLRGLLRCKSCGHSMVHTFTTKGNKRYRYYTCTHAIKAGRRQCPAGSLPAAEVEQTVVDQIRQLVQEPSWIEATVAAARHDLDKRRGQYVTEQRSLKRAIADDAKAIERLVTQRSTAPTATSQVADLNDRIRAAEQRLGEVAADLALLDHQQIGEREVVVALRDFNATWDTLSPREQVRLLQQLVEHVEFDAADSTIEVTFHAMNQQLLEAA